jgi:hypothetical protein
MASGSIVTVAKEAAQSERQLSPRLALRRHKLGWKPILLKFSVYPSRITTIRAAIRDKGSEDEPRLCWPMSVAFALLSEKSPEHRILPPIEKAVSHTR